MAAPTIQSIRALEILDSRGMPTLRAWVVLANGVVGVAAVPSGASTGQYEAAELRDGDPHRYQGKGVRKAVASVNDRIAPALVGHDPSHQSRIDQCLIDLDGTPSKMNLGANAMLAVSMATARAAAQAHGVPLYIHLADKLPNSLPLPMMNVINGGKHADNNLEFQEFMIVPIGAPSFGEALRYGVETFQALKRLLHRKGFGTAVGDEGGFAPNLPRNEDACEMIVEAIEAAGFQPGRDVAMALDPAATSFWNGGQYDLSKSGLGMLTSTDLGDLYRRWVSRYPIFSIEDGFAETDWDGFKRLTASMGTRLQIVGDDIFVTNSTFIKRGITEQTANAVLIKLNQIGTVTETKHAVALARDAGWNVVVSHRSGETEDAFMGDFAVAVGAHQIKAGSPCRSERVAKYNRLLEIEAELGGRARLAPVPSFGGSKAMK